ncbi:hypothetical protein D9758_014269 [Tetrapyrgos nigripes]|uniref:HSF-type DNA-binding domain-containing protein n=1 Tax=Tetrapyrgos nigripes TaxID=182062 RepID=A0A8H5FIH4_9AGAR|nr:hypothetical protein D9758_014269 [Tetrapyrgos nigripes]
MDSYNDSHYQQGQRQQQAWSSHMMSQSQPFPSPPASTIGEHAQQQQHYQFTPQSQQQPQPTSEQQQQQQQPMHHLGRLSLNLSSLTVASPTNLSPIGPPQQAPSNAMSPATPISPSNATQGYHHIGAHSQFQFNPPAADQIPSTSSATSQKDSHSPERPYGLRISTPASGASGSRSSSTSASTSTSGPPSRKRSFTSQAPPTSTVSASTPGAPTLIEENYAFDDGSTVHDHDTPMDDYYTSATGPGNGATSASTPGGGGSPTDGGSGGSGGEDGMSMGGMMGGGPSTSGASGNVGGVGSNMGMLGKPMPTNNFVTKLYQMINDPKSSHFITWTELGTSFVVSNVGEFSRSILGSHFKHNNFSSFVRQLNMYGFHKINRTPRAQRTSSDAQTWEFSHHKFLRGRPDLLDEIKRKALEPDPAIKHRVELPGEVSVAAQLGQMREENRRMWDQLAAEKRKNERMVNLMARLWDVVNKGFPGMLPTFPQDVLDSSQSDQPNIYITSPTSVTPAPRFPQLLGQGHLGSSIHSMSSPSSSPTTAEFSPHIHHMHSGHGHQTHGHHSQPPPHSLSRQHSFPHNTNPNFTPRSESPNDTMEMFDDPANNSGGDGDGPPGSSGSNGNTSTVTSPSVPSMSSSMTSISSLASPGGDGPGDQPGVAPITGRSGTKRQRISNAGDDVMVGMPNMMGMMNGASASSDSLLSNGSMGGMGMQMGNGLSVASMNVGVGMGMGGGLNPPEKKLNRARSDSAPLGYGITSGLNHHGSVGPGGNTWGTGVGRPRSGSGLAMVHGHSHGRIPVPNIGTMARGIPGSGNAGGNGMPGNNAPSR